MAAPYKPKDLITPSVPANPPPDLNPHPHDVSWQSREDEREERIARDPTDEEIAAYLKRQGSRKVRDTMTEEEMEAANIEYRRRIALAERAAIEEARSKLVPTPKSQLVVVKLLYDYWPTLQQVLDNPQVPSTMSILPPPRPDTDGVPTTIEARFRTGATIYLDMDTALKLLSEQKAVRADPLQTVAGECLMTDEIRDGAWTLYEHDAELGRTIWHLREDGMDHFRIDYEVGKILEQNKAEFNSADKSFKEDWVKVASVPHNILHGSGLEEANQQRDKKWVSNWLNDPDNRAWRTKPGKV